MTHKMTSYAKNGAPKTLSIDIFSDNKAIRLPNDATASSCVRSIICILSCILSDPDLHENQLSIVRLLPQTIDAWQYITNPQCLDLSQLNALHLVCEYFRESFDLHWSHDSNDDITAVAQLEEYYLPILRKELRRRL